MSEWKSDPYVLKIEKDYSYGLGVVNCKGSAAVHLYLSKNFKRLFPNIKENIDFTFVTDEENLGPDGTEYLRRSKKIKPHTLILGAPTNNNFVIEERGVFWVEVNISGKTSHAGEPHKGINAIEKSAKIISELSSKFKKELKKFNISCEIDSSSIKIKENQNIVQPKSTIECHNDHRIAMSIAPLSMKVDSIKFDDKNVVNKSYPKFWEDFNSVSKNKS